MLKVYFKADCHTCRTALQLINELNEPEISTTEYLVEVPSENEIRDLVRMLNCKAIDLIRKKEPLFQNKYLHAELNDDQWIKIKHENPILIERPIVVYGDKAIIGRPAETVIDFINNEKKKK